MGAGSHPMSGFGKRQPVIVDGAAHSAQARGRAAENLAAAHLERHGMRIVARNVRCRGGEVDLVGVAGGCVVFVEVRLRRPGRHGDAGDSITAAKQRRVLLAAQWWLAGSGRRFRHAPCRFDAVLLDALDDTRIRWLAAAFDASALER